MKTFDLMFAPMFIDRVVSQEKRHTIRRRRKSGRQIGVGDQLRLRRWVGRPYGKGSRNEVFLEATVNRVSSIEILTSGAIVVDGTVLPPENAEHFAKLDGFESRSAMMEWHRKNSHLPFDGVLIEWSKQKEGLKS